MLDGRPVHPHGVPQRGMMLGGFKETSDDAFIVGTLVRRERVMNPHAQGEVFIPVVTFARNFTVMTGSPSSLVPRKASRWNTRLFPAGFCPRP